MTIARHRRYTEYRQRQQARANAYFAAYQAEIRDYLLETLSLDALLAGTGVALPGSG